MFTISNERLAKLFPAIHPRNKASRAFWISQRTEICVFLSIEEKAVITLVDPDAISDNKTREIKKKCIGLSCVTKNLGCKCQASKTSVRTSFT